MVLAAEALCDVRVQEGDEAEGAEGLRDEDVGDFAKLGEIVPQVIGGEVFRAAPDKHLTGHLLDHALLRVGHLHFAPAAIDEVALGQHPQLHVVGPETNKAEALRLARLDVLLHLRHQHLAERLKVLAQALLGGLPGEPEDDQVRAPHPRLHALRFCRRVLQVIVALPLVLCNKKALSLEPGRVTV